VEIEIREPGESARRLDSSGPGGAKRMQRRYRNPEPPSGTHGDECNGGWGLGPYIQCSTASIGNNSSNQRPKSGRIDRAAGEAAGSRNKRVLVGDGGDHGPSGPLDREAQTGMKTTRRSEGYGQSSEAAME
jgi:hypothetical protein